MSSTKDFEAFLALCLKAKVAEAQCGEMRVVFSPSFEEYTPEEDEPSDEDVLLYSARS